MKKQMMIFSLFLSSFITHADENFTPQKFTWTYYITAKDFEGVNDDIQVAVTQMRNLITETAKKGPEANSSNFFQQLLVFIKELQEAIAAGFNLFGSVSTSQEPLLQLAEEVAAQTLEQVVEDVTITDVKAVEPVTSSDENSPVATTKSPHVTITFSCIAANAAELESWNTAKALLLELADSINNNTISSEALVASIIDIYQSLTNLSNASLDVSVPNLDVASE